MSYYTIVMTETCDTLQHHGIKGQKWGVRRYQNPDGSLTDEGKKRVNKQIKGSGAVRIAPGQLKMYRTSKNENSDANGKKMYVVTDQKEAKYYQAMMGSGAVIRNGKAFAQKYENSKELVLPSLREQTKIERQVQKDADVQKEIVESLVAKGYDRIAAQRYAKPYSAGRAWLKTLPTIPIGVFNPAIPAMVALTNFGDESVHDKAFRVTVGDENAKKLNAKLEESLRDKGYNAYRDTNDRNNGVRSKTPIVVIDSDKNTKMTSSKEFTKDDFAKAYAEYKVTNAINKGIGKKEAESAREGFEKDGETQYKKLLEAHVQYKKAAEDKEKILKENEDFIKKKLNE